VRSLHAVYNEAFADLWGFVPISLDEFAERAASFRPFFRPELLIIAEAEARAVGFALLLPDINEVLAPLRGRLLPFGWFRLMRAIPRIRSGRFILIGVAPEFASRGLAPVLAAEIQAAGRRLGLDPVEISLVAGVRSLHAVYNEAFADLWGFVPISLDEFAERAASFRPFFRPELLIIAEAEARAVGFALLLPDINEVLAPLRGRLLPFGWFRLMRAIPRIRSGRFILIGVAPEFASRGLAPVLAAEIQDAGRRLGLDPVEISLVAGANRAMQRVIEAFGCPHTKTFRLYRKSLVPDVAPTPYTARE
jgi:GNAT superfamily N-acetyltransferase